MAMTINSSPILKGKSALAFFEEAERNGKFPTPHLSAEQEARFRNLELKYREFHHRLFGKNNE